MGEIFFKGAKTKVSNIVVQFGLAIIPSCFKTSEPFTSGTTMGTSFSNLNALELSINTAF